MKKYRFSKFFVVFVESVLYEGPKMFMCKKSVLFKKCSLQVKLQCARAAACFGGSGSGCRVRSRSNG